MSERADIVWWPDADAFHRSQMGEFARRHGLDDYASLHEWSIADIDRFWLAFSEWANIEWTDRSAHAIQELAMPAKWFDGASLNFASHALRMGGGIISVSQTRPRVELTADELRAQVRACRRGLTSLGVQKGDVVASYLPNVSETVVAFLATASLGAVWTSCAPEFGVKAVTDRLTQLAPKVLFSVDGYVYGTKEIDRRREVDQIVAEVPSLQHVVVVPYLDRDGENETDPTAVESNRIRRRTWSSLLGSGKSASEFGAADRGGLEAVAVSFDHPLYVLFSSGTTGQPKPIVHGHGGITLEHSKVLMLHHDLRPGDRFMWFTTTGWMMWNYLVSGLLAGATIVLFDGDPVHPGPECLWDVAADELVDVLGLSAGFIMAARKLGFDPKDGRDLSRLRQLGSTGAPLSAEGFHWIRDVLGSSVQPVSISGGTDVCTAFVGTAPSVPVRAGEISTSMLGCDVRAFDESGRECPVNVTGELVVVKPMPSMPVGLWGDHSGDRFRSTYFETYPGLWHHGDWITFFNDGACLISGRSDATLNRGGVRLGTADFYAVIDSREEISDSLVIHVEDRDGGPGVLYLLIVPAPGHAVDSALKSTLSGVLRRELSPRHVPDVVVEIPAVPRTLSGKKLEVPVKRLLQGHDAQGLASRESLLDPNAWDAIVEWSQSIV